MVRVSRRTTIVLAILAAVTLLVIARFDWNWFKGPVASIVSRQIGRPFAITGDLRVELSRQPRITADGIVMGNAPWGSAPQMAQIRQVRLRIDGWELLKGHLVVPELTLSGANLLLEKSSDGHANWELGTAAPGSGGGLTPRVETMGIDHGTVVYRDPANATDVEVSLATTQVAPPEAQTVEARVQGHVAGRQLSVGRAVVTLSPMLRITADDVVLVNVPWGTRPNLAEIGQVVAEVDPQSLGSGRLVLRELILSHPDILLERSADGKRNWDVGAGTGTGSAVQPQLGSLVIQAGRFRYRDPQTKTDVRFDVATPPPRPGDPEPMMTLKGGGRYKAAPFELDGRVGTLLALHDVAHPYPIDIKARVGETRAVVQGGVMTPLELRGFKVTLQLEGSDLSQLYPFIPVPLPVTPPYRVSGQLDHATGVWTFTRFSGRVGDSDLGGDFSVDLRGPRPLMRGALVSRNLAFRDLAGLVGAKPEAQPPASAEHPHPAVEGPGERVLPDEPYRLDRLHAADADVRFRGERVISSLPLDNVTAHLVLQDGRLTLRPLSLGVAGGTIQGAVTMDARQHPIASALDLDVQTLEVKRLFPGFRLQVASAGLIGGRARLEGRGDSVAAMLGSANGNVALVMSGGGVSPLVLDLADLDVPGSLFRWVTGDKHVPIDCLVADFQAKDGRMAAKTLVLDSPHTLITGSGTIDFKEETLDLRVKAESKHPSLVALRGPIEVTGRFKHPAVRLNPVQMTVRAGAAAVLGVLFPPAAILPFVELGLTKSPDCGALVESAEQRVASSAGASPLETRETTREPTPIARPRPPAQREEPVAVDAARRQR